MPEPFSTLVEPVYEIIESLPLKDSLAVVYTGGLFVGMRPEGRRFVRFQARFPELVVGVYNAGVVYADLVNDCAEVARKCGGLDGCE